MQLHIIFSLVAIQTCPYVTGEVLLSMMTSSYSGCKALCVHLTHCAGYRWEVTGRMCTLTSTPHSDQTRDVFVRVDGSSHSIIGNVQILSTRVCEDRPCREDEVCVPVTSGTAQICLMAPPRDMTSSTSTQTSYASLPTSVGVSSRPETDLSVATSPTTVEHTIVDTTNTISAWITSLSYVGTVKSSTTTSSTTKTPIPTTTTTTITTTATTTTTTTTTTTATTTPTTTTAPATTAVSVTYIGCYQDKKNRLLPNAKTTNKGLTTQICFLHCHDKGYKYFGTQNKRECYCGNVIKDGYAMVSDAQCSSNCAGDPETKCGGTWRISVREILVKT
ncbi:uncharacterized protein [Haliotis asinina]|uniref:uncharacterized protein n=1 Tax=Haliotis asinina TaxID=109174 RepID=UPI003532249E